MNAMVDDPTPVGPDSLVGPESPLGQRAASGVLWLTAQKWVVRLAGLATIAILTRLLSPEDFGVVAAAMTVLPFFYLLSDLGFATYIVQADAPDQRVLSSGFWFSAVAGLVLTAVLFAAAPLFGVMFSSPDVIPVIQVLSIAVLFTAVSSVPTALLRRRMQFRALAVQGLVASVLAQVVAIAMALSGLGVWALVGQTLTSQVVMTILACVAARWLPSWLFSWPELKAMTTFGTKVLSVELVAMTRAAVEAAIVSASLGLTAFGYLTIAQKLVQIVQDLTGAAVLPVTTVAFAKLRGSAERLTAAYTRALRMLYAVMAPPLVLLAVAGPLIIPIVFGPGWEQSFRVAQFLALAGTVVVGATLDHGLFYGLGRPGRWFFYAVVVDILTVAVTALAVHSGLVAVAVGFLIVAVVATIGRWFLVAGLIRTPVRSFARPFVFLITTVLVSGGAGLAVIAITGTLPPIVRIILAGAAVLAAHAGVASLLVRPVFGDLAAFVPRHGRQRTSHRPKKEIT
ncbi:MAG: lipopolysaccharide biosynthesis protein [Microbacterium sp.]